MSLFGSVDPPWSRRLSEALRLHGPGGSDPRIVPLPLAHGELDLLRRPTTSLAFPPHPLGRLRLYVAAHELARDALVCESDAEVQKLSEECWRAACELFKPGVAVRVATDEFAQRVRDGRKLRDEDANRATVRAAALAATADWAALQAAVEWVEDAP